MEQVKQTAVNWLVCELFGDNDIIGCSDELLKQAKEMEKQQIIDAYNDAEDKCEYFIEEHTWQRYNHLSENYYKQTFKSE
jgi:trimethylamine:corrinoid methyltransferase-like protein